MGGKLMNGIKSIYVNNLACIIVKGGESECFGINGGVRQGCIMSPWFFNAYSEGENGDWKEESEISGGVKKVETAWPLVCR